MESLLYDMCEEYFPELTGKDYFIFGTLDRKDWKKFQEEVTYSKESLEKAYVFKDVWKFKPASMECYPADNSKKTK